jgi:hypothetical protein
MEMLPVLQKVTGVGAGPGTHAPAEQTSPMVHMLPSLQGRVLFV